MRRRRNRRRRTFSLPPDELALAIGLGYAVLVVSGALAAGWLTCFFGFDCFFHQQWRWVGAAAVLGFAYGAGGMARALRPPADHAIKE